MWDVASRDRMSYDAAMTRKQLRKLIEDAGLSQAKAARLIGLTDRSMRRYLAGDVEIPRSVEYAVRYVIEHGIEEKAK
jgi:DNA transposition AAA+ family ATPase